MNSDHFKNLSLTQPILRALSDEGYHTPTPIQHMAIPQVLAGKDLLATAQTGTGKTAAFSLPILQLLHERHHNHARCTCALILTPTRELALQVEASLRTYGRYLSLRTAVILGGVPAKPQIKALRNNPDILVATPGRLLDLHQQGHVHFDKIEMFVLDEADRMLDMGFINDIRKIVAMLPKDRQTLFFSATLFPEIAELAFDMLKHPSLVEVSPAASVSGNIEQKVLFVEQVNKHDLLTGILKDEKVNRALVFTRTKRQADSIKRKLTGRGINADVIHSDKTQKARQRALSAFDCGRIKVLIGTDIVARGIDVDGISHVINFELPNNPESYVHRIGRTARAGAEGTALSFCTADEIAMLRRIEKLTKCSLSSVEDHPFYSSAIAARHESISALPITQPLWGRRRINKLKKPMSKRVSR